MRTSKSQLLWLRLWTLRILFWPIWIWAINRRYQRELNAPFEPVKVLVHGVEQKQSEVTYNESTPGTVEITKADKIEMTFIPKVSPWSLELVDEDGTIYMDQPAQLDDTGKDLVLRAEFNIEDSVTLTKSRAVRNGKLIGVKEFKNPIPCTEHDIIKMDHALILEERKECAEVEFKKEAPKNPELCRIQLMTANSPKVQRVDDYEHILTSKRMKLANFEYYSIDVLPVVAKVELLWQGKPIHELDDKHLWNIIQAVKKKQWASGSPARFSLEMEQALVTEYDKRLDAGRYTKKRVKKIKKKNEKYDRKVAEEKASEAAARDKKKVDAWFQQKRQNETRGNSYISRDARNF
jgi:hypothetical protein